MRRRPTDDGAGGVLSFTYLDVLTCTMGTLLLILVCFGEKAKLAALAEAAKKLVAAPPAAPREGEAPVEPPPGITLAELRQREQKLQKLRVDAAEQFRQEQLRVSHLEDHERRLEHELAQLHIVLERLESTEEKQKIDQSTADADLEHLKELIADTEKELEEARTDQRPRSYAIVPYKGANGTTRRPIYVECTREAVIIQPEGIRLTPQDFDGPIRSGNPLAAAVRAAREHLNARALAAGQEAQPDPYPLLIIRPGGSDAYAAALSAIQAFDQDFGYEFVEADWKLQYPATDPQLEQVMVHAVDQARTRQALLARAAPGRYGRRLGGGDSSEGGADGDGVGGYSEGGFEVITQSGGAGGMIGEGAADGSFGSQERNGTSGDGQSDNRYANGRGGGGRNGRYGSGSGGGTGGEGNFSDEFNEGQAGAAGAGTGRAGGTGGLLNRYAENGAGGTGGTSAGGGDATGAGEAGGTPGGAPGGSSGGAATGATSGSQSGAPSGATSLASSGTPTIGAGPDVHTPPSNAPGAANGSGQSASGAALPAVGVKLGRGPKSMADSRGANWANAEAARRSAAITRPIKVIVRPGELVVLTEGESISSAANDSTVVSFNQPIDAVMDQLVVTLKEHIDRWGLAGRDMYWRPMLMLKVAAGADRQAVRIAELLDNSGVDVRIPVPEVAAQPAKEASHAR